MLRVCIPLSAQADGETVILHSRQHPRKAYSILYRHTDLTQEMDIS